MSLSSFDDQPRLSKRGLDLTSTSPFTNHSSFRPRKTSKNPTNLLKTVQNTCSDFDHRGPRSYGENYLIAGQKGGRKRTPPNRGEREWSGY